MQRSFGWMFLFFLLMPCAAHARQAELIGPDLEPRTVELRSLSSDGFVITDWRGQEQSLPPDQVMRLTFGVASPVELAGGRVVVRLRDGQVLVGRLTASSDDELIRLSMDGRSIELSLDELLSITLDASAALPGVIEDDDVLLLKTGEALKGFVETISDTSVGFIVGDAKDPIPIPLDRVKALWVANKPRPTEKPLGVMRVLTTDGSSLLLRGVGMKPASGDDAGDQLLVGKPVLGFEPASFSVSMGKVLRIEPLGGTMQLSSLLDSSMTVVEGGEVFGVPMPPEKDGTSGLLMHAPVVLGFVLPQGAARLTMRVALDFPEDTPRERKALAGCELVIYSGDEQAGSYTLSPDTPAKRLNLPISGDRLRLELKPGVNGPVLDRVRISDAELLIVSE